MQTKMKRRPDLIVVLLVAFVFGAILTGVSQSDLQIVSFVSQAFAG